MSNNDDTPTAPSPQPDTVVVSGSDINRVITFGPSTTAPPTQSVPLGLTDDPIGLETDETYELFLIDVDSSVSLGQQGLFTTTQVTITDDDGR